MTITEMITKRTGSLPAEATPAPDVTLVYTYRRPGSAPPLCTLTPPVEFFCTPPDQEQVNREVQDLRDKICRRVLAPGQKLDVCELCHQNIADVSGNLPITK